GWTINAKAGRPSAGPTPRQTTITAGASAIGSRTCVVQSQPIHSRVNCHGRVTSSRPRGSWTPASQPSRPPSILAAAGAGTGVPTVARLKATAGASATAARPMKTPTRRRVGGVDSAINGSSTIDSGRASGASAANSSVHSGAVEPATGTPGLYEKPAPSAMLRANWRWIHESSRGKPAAPAMRRSEVSRTASGTARATTRRTLPRRPDGTTRCVLAHEGVARIVHGLAADAEQVQIAAVRKLDLGEAERALGQRAPVVHEPDELLDARGQRDVALGHA